MSSWLDNIGGSEAGSAVWALMIVLAVIVALAAMWRIYRGLTSGTFIAGGRNRKARLAVIDAAAIDSKRRVVLIRRDDVEHLLLIGGPTDVVVESRIDLAARSAEPLTGSRRPSQPDIAAATREQNKAQPRNAPSSPPPPAPAPPPSGEPVETTPTARPPQATVPTPRAAASQPPVSPAVAGASHTAPDIDPDLDRALRAELHDQSVPRPPSSTKDDTALEEEMEKLLGDLSSQTRR